MPVALKLGRTSESIQDWDGAIAAYQTVAANAQGPEKAEGLTGRDHQEHPERVGRRACSRRQRSASWHSSRAGAGRCGSWRR